MARILENIGLTFDNVVLVSQKSPVDSRSQVNTETFLTRNIRCAFRLFRRMWIWLPKP